MPEPLLNVMKIMLLAGLYLFFVCVLWSVYNELRDPRTRVQARPDPNPARRGGRDAPAGVATARRPVPAETAPRQSGAVAVAPVAAGVQVGQLMVIEPAPMAGVTWALGNEITIGRAPTCGIQIDDTYVSSVHARIFSRSGVFVIDDLDSRNGTVVNDELIAGATELRQRDRVQFGTTILEFS